MRTAQQIEENKAQREKSEQAPKRKRGEFRRGQNPRSRQNLAKPYPKGVSGNPSGKPGYDVAAELARAIISEFKEEAFAGLGKALSGGNAYVFKELAERGYGKLTDKVHVSTDDAIIARLMAGRKRISELK